ncbi:hypothetical protein DFR60_102524 [Hungatella effluvii]|uniref:Uncharacterized protein n=1 Tax=Hungatella effluvii TaxID=1096246 RepID=A0A2V3YD50_9FIRM|nr:hypothetical protein [Hungatella effluvii]PXX56249.1 hypothetical protein DFR60_102524 [Hungatella effluvii]
MDNAYALESSILAYCDILDHDMGMLYDRLFIGEFLRRNHRSIASDIACTGFPCASGSIQALPAQYSLLVGHIAAPKERTSGKCSIPWRRSMAGPLRNCI